MSLRFVISAILVCGLSISPALASETSDAAFSMVKTLGLGNNLGQMGLRVAETTQTFRIIAQKVGNEKAMVLVKENLENVLPKYQEKWNNNLAQSYAEYFDAVELRSITDEKQSSKYFGKFKSRQGDVGKRMQEKSSGLLTQYVTEAMNKSFTKAVK
jgi:hypothetical protein